MKLIRTIEIKYALIPSDFKFNYGMAVYWYDAEICEFI